MPRQTEVDRHSQTTESQKGTWKVHQDPHLTRLRWSSIILGDSMLYERWNSVSYQCFLRHSICHKIIAPLELINIRKFASDPTHDWEACMYQTPTNYINVIITILNSKHTPNGKLFNIIPTPPPPHHHHHHHHRHHHPTTIIPPHPTPTPPHHQHPKPPPPPPHPHPPDRPPSPHPSIPPRHPTAIPGAAYMRQWVRSALFQIIACRLFGAKPSSWGIVNRSKWRLMKTLSMCAKW